MSTVSQKIKLLSWKYLCYRKYYWSLTLAEFCLPLLSVYLAVRVVEQVIESSGVSSLKQGPTISKRIYYPDIADTVNYDCIFYTPYNEETETYMSTVVQNISSLKTNQPSREILLIHVQSEMELVSNVSQYAGNAIGIVFLEITNKQYKYKIRDKNVWNTNEMFLPTETEHVGPYESDPYFTSGFMGLQYFTDMAYIQVELRFIRGIARTDIKARAMKNFWTSFQPFPYPAYTKTSKFRNLIPLFIAFMIVIVSLMLLCPLIFAVIREKKSGVREMMKLVGLDDGLIWFGWWINTFFLGAIVYGIIAVILVRDFRGPDHATIRHIQWSLLWIVMILYFLSQNVFCFCFCTIFHNILLAVCSFCILTFVLGYAALKANEFQNVTLVYLSCLFPVGAFVQAFRRMAYHELLEVPLTWDYMFTKEYGSADVPLGIVFFLFIFDTMLYSVLTYYFNKINPGKYGEKKSPFFLFQSEEKREIAPLIYEPIHKRDALTKIKKPKNAYPQIVETVPPGTVSILTVENLHKKFGPIEAVKGVNLNMYTNEILTLVGNGANGKTTTISMILGLLEPTEGTIIYRGSIDLLNNREEFRKDLGYCPQENRLFPYFSIIDHLFFYGMLKGMGKLEAAVEATNYLQLMGIRENADDLTSVISGEMRRKTSIGIALMGNSEILVLDEPTSGLDFAAKNRIWNLLAELKRDRTMIIATSTMREASAVADRIAIMNKGVLVCSGSNKFLNKAFATGYELRMKKVKQPTADPTAKPTKDPTLTLISEIKKTFPGTKTFHSSTEVVFNIPSFETSKFPALFKALEGRKTSLNIDTIGVSCLTLENVFLKIGGESIYDIEGRPLKLDTLVVETLEKSDLDRTDKLKGIALLVEQNRVLFFKKLILIYRDWFLFLYRVLLPTIIMAVLIRGTTIVDIANSPLEFSFELYPKSIFLFRKHVYTSTMFYTLTQFLNQYNIPIVYSKQDDEELNFTDISLMYARDNLNSYRREIVIGGDLRLDPDSDAFPGGLRTDKFDNLLMYNKFARHSLPVSVNMMNTALLRFEQRDNEYKITTINHPIIVLNETKARDHFNTNLGEHSPILSVWYILCAFFTIDLLGYITIPSKAERLDGFKHIQLLSGLSLLTYWINTLIFDFALSFAIMALRLLLFKCFDYYGFFTLKYDFLIALSLITLYLVCGLLFEYTLSFILGSRYGEYTIFFIMNLICTFVTFTYYRFQTYYFSIGAANVFLSIAKYIILLIPPLNFSLAFVKYIMAWRVNHIVTAYAEQRTNEHSASKESEPKISEHVTEFRQENPAPFLDTASQANPNGIFEEFVFLAVDLILYSALIYIIELDYIGRFLIKKNKDSEIIEDAQPETEDAKNIPPILEKESSIPEDVLNERSRVQSASQVAATGNGETNSVVLISQGLRRTYRDIFARKRIMVDDASFLVNAGECFGIIGPKGSGKTTTFKMLTGEMTPSAGESWIFNTDLSNNRTKYFANIGYCAQSDSFLQEMTGNETLNFVSTLRGIPIENRIDLVEKWSTILGMENITARCSDYNEGERRKLCATLALIGDPNVVLLDEPTTGIDPIARLSLYTILRHIKSTGQSVVVSSQSMQECEALCDRFTIMVNGEMKFIGSLDELKQRYAQAISLTVIMKDMEEKDTEDSRLADIQSLKFAVTGKFKSEACVLIKESKTLVHYEIKYMVPWSEAFMIMEQIKISLKFIKEYQLAEKSLEDIFTYFAEET